MTLASVRLIARNNRYDCVMPVEHIGAWVQAMAECGALALYLLPERPRLPAGIQHHRASVVKRSPLARPTLEQVQRWQRKPRKAIRRLGRRALRNQASLEEFRSTVCLRAEGLCEAAGLAGPEGAVCLSRPHSGSQAHHLWPEDRARNLHDPARGLWCCHQSHRWLHDHPAEAHALGLLRPEEA